MDALAECSSVQAAVREPTEELREHALLRRIEGPALAMLDDVYLDRPDRAAG